VPPSANSLAQREPLFGLRVVQICEGLQCGPTDMLGCIAGRSLCRDNYLMPRTDDTVGVDDEIPSGLGGGMQIKTQDTGNSSVNVSFANAPARITVSKVCKS
jgi:hypothetical protein